MYPKAIRDLAQKCDDDLFELVAQGMGLVIENGRRLAAACSALAEAEQHHAARVLLVIAEEEAAKFMILLDAVRCPRQPAERFAAHLRRFNDHLAKGLYARACEMRPTTLQQLQVYLNRLRREFHLDGPNDVDWIFRNEIKEERDGLLYVDYVKTDDGEHHWSDPGRSGRFIASAPPEPAALKMAGGMFDLGIASADALRAVADVWRNAAIVPETPWDEFRQLNWQTLKELEVRTILLDIPEAMLSWVIDRWQFPMYCLDLTEIKVPEEHLRDRQAMWCVDA